MATLSLAVGADAHKIGSVESLFICSLLISTGSFVVAELRKFDQFSL